MEMETIHVNLNPEEYFSKMKPEDSTAITTMCLDKLCEKAQELKDLYTTLAKTYGIEMGICDITCIVQVSVPKLPFVPVLGLLGTTDGIKNGLAKLMTNGLKQLADAEKEDANDAEE